jgi:RNA-directed DNA polymerase
VADRIAQTVVCMVLEPTADPVFHPDSYGYRPGRSALHAVAKARRRCWENDRIIDMDIRAFFDTVPWDLVLRAVKYHCREPWVLLYVKRWLEAPLRLPDGTISERTMGTPQGGLCEAEHKPPYEQRRVMRSAGLLALVTATLALERCA